MPKKVKNAANQPKVVAEGALGQGLDSTKVIGKARAEKNAQAKLDAMVLSIANGTIALSKDAENAKKELERIKKVRSQLQEKSLQSMSDYSVLAQLYNGRLKSITKADLLAIEANNAEKFQNRFFNPASLNDKQKETISRYYSIKAEKSWNVIAQVEAVLIWAKVIQPKKAEEPAEVQPEEQPVVQEVQA